MAWNVVAPAGSEPLVVAAVERVMIEAPDAGGVEFSRRVAALVPGARVGPLANDDDDDDDGLRVELSDEDVRLLRTLVDASSVFERPEDVALAMLRIQIDMAREDAAYDVREALRFLGGMTDDEKARYDRIQAGLRRVQQLKDRAQQLKDKRR